MVNDVCALRVAGALEAVTDSDAAVCLMHMQGDPRTMQLDPRYEDVVRDVAAFLEARAHAAVRAGIARERILLDPGFGFGKSPQHNLSLIRGLPALAALGYPLLVGLSRKSLLGRIVRRVSDDRVHASVAAALAAVARGAHVVRVHDVAATHDALSVWRAIEDEGYRFDEQ
jgi:dihydropteroate synthase